MEEKARIYSELIKKIGGAAMLLSLPDEIKDVLKFTTDLDTKIFVLEIIAANVA